MATEAEIVERVRDIQPAMAEAARIVVPNIVGDHNPGGETVVVHKGRLMADLAETLDARIWKPIATAPKDGTAMLLAVKYKDSAVVLIGGFDAHWSGNCWVYRDPRVDRNEPPTHWMHLPAPPQKQE